jgi:4a-hydroxytetrahydrobiopterin dehydratase
MKILSKLTNVEKSLFVAKMTTKGWSSTKTSICKEFIFKDFQNCFSFMTLVALKADKLNHHPEWINCYNKLKINLTTHDCDGLSIRDQELSEFIEEHYQKFRD